MERNRTIASERTRLGLTQGQLASKLNVARETVSRWETGEWEPSSTKIHEMAGIFHCSVDYLLGKTEERVV